MEQLLMFGILVATFHVCHSDTAFCNLPHDEGTGSSIQLSTYYDSRDSMCYPFIYKGEGGNLNRFDNERECMRNCSNKVNEFYPMDASQACHFPKVRGKCNAFHLRYFYDSIHDKCKKFLWSGCIGNGNRFVDQKSCNDTCAGIHNDGDALEEDEPDTPVALICGVVFGIVGAIFLIVIVVLMVKSKNTQKPKRPKREEKPLQDKAIEMA